MSANFYKTDEWRKLRYLVLRNQGFKCSACGAKGSSTMLHVDHIKPRSKHPELALKEENLQVLCEDCNLGKGSEFADAFREESLSTEAERKEVRRQTEILQSLDVFAAELRLTAEQKTRVRRAAQRFIAGQQLRERARKLLRVVPDGFEADALQAVISNTQRTSEQGPEGVA